MSYTETTSELDSQMTSLDRCIERVWPDPESRPCRRTVQQWQAQKLIPVVKIGRRVFYIPRDVREAVLRNCTVNAV